MPETQQKPNKPELKIGPFPGGISVEVWLNQTHDGRYFRSITIAPRSYRDDDGNWKEGAYRLVDLPALILALQKAQDYGTTTPLPGEPAHDTETNF
jgi:hypothetical protein